MEYKLTAPPSKADAAKLRAGDTVCLLYTSALHQRSSGRDHGPDGLRLQQRPGAECFQLADGQRERANGLVSYPRVIGHELAGVVVSIPENNKNGIKVGDRVVVDPYLYCGKRTNFLSFA